MSSLPAFSLLLPVYHGDDPQFLGEAFRSAVHDQVLKPDEVVLVQDGPVGDALSAAIRLVVASSPVPVNHVVLEENRGLATALTRGLDACEFDVVARMDADDIALPERFDVQIPLIASGFDLVGSALSEFTVGADGVEQILGKRTPPLSAENIRLTLPFRAPFNHPTVVYRRECVAAAGGYLPMGQMEDYWLFGRMITAGVKAMNVSDALVKYRVSSGAYARRGGIRLLTSEVALQRAFRQEGITTRTQFLRNVLLRGGYRLIPEFIRKRAYRGVFVSRNPRDGQAKQNSQ